MAEVAGSADDDIAEAVICLNGVSKNVGAQNLFGCTR